ncbi:MAG: hypothetical protein NC337_13390 [Roseburia sp.]|nr:hypothetical protein [Roseburia sp.]
MWNNKWQDGLKRLMEKINKETMLILFLGGILIFVILLPTDSGRKSNSREEQTAADGNTAASETTERYVDAYKEALEAELEEFLSGVAGVGEVKVMIYMERSTEYIVEKDSATTGSEESDRRETSKEEDTVYTTNAAGEQVPFIAQTVRPRVDGVAVAAKGANQEMVRLQIVRLVMALFGVEANKVEVMPMQ